ncbi:MAG: type IV pilus modification protein PilV [Gammaproteobacteria bacterium]|nr:type IV pilus modification protein PilV [Gammaproteobacteria bacterium]
MLAYQKIGSKNKQQGFTLMEVMIAAFVLSVGMLGSTAMMLRGMQEADRTNYEAVAAQTAMNMAERMRGNITGVLAGDYDGGTSTTAAVDCSSTLCNSAGVADYHLYIWGTELTDLLPSNSAPTGSVDVLVAGTDTTDPTYTLTVNWTSNQRTGTDTGSVQTQTYEMIFQP